MQSSGFPALASITGTLAELVPLLKEVDQHLIHCFRLLMMQPMRVLGKVCELGRVAISDALLRHLGQQELVALAPENPRGHMYLWIAKVSAVPYKCAIPVHHGSQRSGISPR